MFTLTLVNSWKYKHFIQEALKMRYFSRRLSKILKFVLWFLNPVSKNPWNRFLDCQICSKVFSFSGPSPDHFWALNWKSFFEFFQKYHPFHDDIVIPFSTSKFLLKFEYCKNQKSKLKSLSFWSVLFLWNINNRRLKIWIWSNPIICISFSRSDWYWHQFEIL